MPDKSAIVWDSSSHYGRLKGMGGLEARPHGPESAQTRGGGPPRPPVLRP
jgi:hypothetical protein